MNQEQSSSKISFSLFEHSCNMEYNPVFLILRAMEWTQKVNNWQKI